MTTFHSSLTDSSSSLKCLCFVFHPDTKNTQWEDPRLQSPAITGPVSSFLCSCSVATHRQQVLLSTLYRTLSSASVTLYNKDKSFCHCGCRLTCRHLHVILCTTSDTVLLHCQLHYLSYTLCSIGGSKQIIYINNSGIFLRILSFSWFLHSWHLMLSAGGSLLERVQAEIRLLQEEIKETGKKWFFKIMTRLLFLDSCWGNKVSCWLCLIVVIELSSHSLDTAWLSLIFFFYWFAC